MSGCSAAKRVGFLADIPRLNMRAFLIADTDVRCGHISAGSVGDGILQARDVIN